MATRLRRIQISLDPETDKVLTDLSKLTGRPIGTIVRELLGEAVDALKVTVGALRLAKTSPEEAVQRMVEMADKSVTQVRQLTMPLKRRAGRPKRG
jgi:hypothetical protein